MIVPAYISKEAFMKLMTGALTTEGGAIRIPDTMQIAELPKILKPGQWGKLILENFPSSGIGAVSGIAGNFQMAHLQKSVNKLDRKADKIIDEIGTLQQSIVSIGNLTALNTVISFAGLAATVIGDCVILNKMKKMEEKLVEVGYQLNLIASETHEMWQMIHSEYRAEYIRNMDEMKTAAGIMDRDPMISISDLDRVEQILNSAASFLSQMIDNFCKNAGNLAPEMIQEYAMIYFAAVIRYLACRRSLEGKKVQHISNRAHELYQKLSSQEIADTLYVYFYNNLPGILPEADLITMSNSLRDCIVKEQYRRFQMLEATIWYDGNLKDPLIVDGEPVTYVTVEK